MNKDIRAYNDNLEPSDMAICEQLFEIIEQNLPNSESKVWHAHPVWFLDGNPIVGYSKLKGDVRLMFWSGQSFEEPSLIPVGSFKASEVRYTAEDQIDKSALKRYLNKSIATQWDYKHIVKNRGLLKLK